MIAPNEIERVKASIDIRELARRYTTLRPKTRLEDHGPCPRCTGNKRFVVNAEGWWFCRDCHEQRGDVIDLVRFVEDCDFVTAVEYISNGTVRTIAPVQPREPEKKVSWDTDAWQAKALDIVDQAAARLETDAGAPGRAYLEQRGISVYTARVWLLGYSADSPPWNKDQRRWLGGPSIVLPYTRHDNDKLMALRYRRINPQEDRYINRGGSHPLLFGLHLLDLNADALFIVEGEINALSLWQVAHEYDLGISVVSIGSQYASDQQLKAVSWLSKRFPRCVVWCDEEGNALKLRDAAQSDAVLPLRSPLHDEQKLDANDMLQRGVLRSFVQLALGETP